MNRIYLYPQNLCPVYRRMLFFAKRSRFDRREGNTCRSGQDSQARFFQGMTDGSVALTLTYPVAVLDSLEAVGLS